MIEYHVTILCNCGREHSFEDWHNCPMALTPRPLEAWWRNPCVTSETPTVDFTKRDFSCAAFGGDRDLQPNPENDGPDLEKLF